MKKFGSLILICALVLALFPLGVFAAEPEGTPIGTAAELMAMEPDGTYYLSDDVTITGEWLYREFQGTLDGNGHTISLDGATLSGGLFAIINGATVRNLNITQRAENTFRLPTTPVVDSYGVLAARATGSNTVENVVAQVNILQMETAGKDAGGLVGNARSGSLSVSGCVYSGRIGSEDARCRFTGGILGSTWTGVTDLSITNCVTYGAYIGLGHTGGLIGSVQEDREGDDKGVTNLTLQYNVNYADVVNTGGAENAGGIIGYRCAPDGGSTRILNNINYGYVANSASNGKVGGIGGNFKQCGTPADNEISGNINYGDMNSKQVSPIYNNFYYDGTWAKDPRPAAVNNYTVEMTDSGENPVPPTTDVLNDGTLDALNAAYPDTYAMDGERITLKWALDAGYTADAFEVTEPEVSGSKDGKLTLDVTVPEPEGTPIATAQELAAISGDGSYYLTQDILVSGEWPSPEDFAGVLHGNGHTVVFNDAEISGGLFRNIAGGKVYDLTIAEATGEGAKSNRFKMVVCGDHMGLGALAGYGYGTFVNITVSCAMGQGYSTTVGNAIPFVGGVIGILEGGDAAVHGCVNLADLAGCCVGGMVGAPRNDGYAAEISSCVNYGSISSTQNVAGGIVGRHDANVAGIVICDCINYGDVTSESAECTGGIMGYQKNAASANFFLLRNVNYGTITNNSLSGEEPWGKPGGILGNLNTNGLHSATVSGNVNYGAIVGNAAPNQMVANPYNGGQITAENNYAVESEVPATVDTAEAGVIDADTLAALNAAYADTYAMQGEQISLKWAVDGGLTSEPPALSYTVDLSQPTIDWSGDGDEDDNDNPDDQTPDENPTTTGTPETETPGTTPADDQPEKGCGSALGASFLLLGVCTAAGAVLLGKKKHE